ncbi:MAG: CaiB/BaiF CoA transferase family protein [Flavobacteriaceae bacterium]
MQGAESKENKAMRPLDGIRIVEAAGYLSGPLSAQMLGTLGAEVIKIEPPHGDAYRNVGHRWNGTGVMWGNCNNGKSSLALDLKSEEGMKKLKELIAETDIFIETWRPRVSAALGLGYEQLSRLNPRLIQVSMTGYGADGELAAQPAYDALIQGRVGLFAYEADGGFPRATNNFVADKVTGMLIAQFMLAALFQRERTGKGLHVETSMLDMMAYYTFPDAMHNRTFVDDDADQAKLPQPVFQTSDGYITLSPVTGKHFGRTLEGIGHPEWKEELKQIKSPKEMSRTFYDRIAGPIREKTSKEWLEIFTALDLPCGPVNNPEDMLKEPQIIHNRVFHEIDTPDGRKRVARYPATFDGQMLLPRGSAPTKLNSGKHSFG